jgi:hypothetical protein
MPPRCSAFAPLRLLADGTGNPELAEFYLNCAEVLEQEADEGEKIAALIH